MKRATSGAEGTTPLYERLCESLRESIASGRLAPGTRLPSTRADFRRFLQQSGYPADAIHFADEDGNALYVHR